MGLSWGCGARTRERDATGVQGFTLHSELSKGAQLRRYGNTQLVEAIAKVGWTLAFRVSGRA